MVIVNVYLLSGNDKLQYIDTFILNFIKINLCIFIYIYGKHKCLFAFRHGRYNIC